MRSQRLTYRFLTAAALLGAVLAGCASQSAPPVTAEPEPPAVREPRPIVTTFASYWDQSRVMMSPVADIAKWDGGGWAYVANEVSGGVTVVDLETGKPIKYIGGGNTTHHVHLTKDQRWALATNRYGSFVFAIDTETNDWHKVEFPGEKPAGPLHISMTPDGKYALVSLNAIGAVGVIDAATAQLVTVVEGVGTQPRDIAVTPDSKKAYVSLQKDPFIAVIDLESLKVAGKIEVPEAKSGSGGLTMSADGKMIALTSTKDKLVALVDVATETVLKVIPGVDQPVNPQFLGTTQWLTTGNRGNSSVTFIDTEKMELVETVESAPGTNIASLGPDGLVYATGNGSKYVAIHDPNEDFAKVGEIPVVQNAHWIVYAPDGRTAYVTNWGFQGISEVDLVERKQLRYIRTGANPNGIAIKFDVPKEAREKALADAERAAQDVADASVLVIPPARTAAEKTFLETCMVCHDVGRIIRNNSGTEAEWSAIVTRMKTNGAEMTAEEQEQILQYLVAGEHKTLAVQTRWQEKYGKDGSRYQ